MIQTSAQQIGRAGSLQSCRFKERFEALGRAVNLLSRVEPYQSYASGAFAGTLAGQIERGHYLFAVRNQEIVGYIGWAMCKEDIAQAWVENRYVPSFKECASGDCYVLMTMQAASRDVVRFLARECRKLYPNHRAYFTRDYKDGRKRRIGTIYNRTRRTEHRV